MNHSFRRLQPRLGNDLDLGILRTALFGVLLCFSPKPCECANGKKQARASQALSTQAVLHGSRLVMGGLERDCQLLQTTATLVCLMWSECSDPRRLLVHLFVCPVSVTNNSCQTVSALLLSFASAMFRGLMV